MHDLTSFSLKDMTECGIELRHLGEGARSFEDMAQRMVTHLHATLYDSVTKKPACALVRLFKTHPYAHLTPDLQRFAAEVVGTPPPPRMKCLTLLGSAGDRSEWNGRRQSKHFKAIPVHGKGFITQFPMFSQLLSQFGLELDEALKPGSELLLEHDEVHYNVFFVPEASGSPYVPAQAQFVIPHGIRSVIGFGSPLPSGDLFAVILFSKVPLSRENADLFKTLSLSAKLALLPFDGPSVFSAP
jgi:hypothetical protein